MQKSPLVSVGIAAYNRPEDLVNCLKSIKNQDYPNLEVIIADDCSPKNNVFDIAKKFKGKKKNIKIFRHKKNIGAAANLEFVLRKSSGKYFFWADDEDKINKKYVSKIVEFLEKRNQVVLCAPQILVQKTNSPSKLVSLITLRQKSWLLTKPLFFQYPISEVFYSFLGIYRTKILKKAGTHHLTCFRNYHINDEVPFLANLSNFGEIRSIGITLKKYKNNSNSNYHKQMQAIKFYEWILLRWNIRLELVKIALRGNEHLHYKIRLIYEIFKSMVLGYFKLLNHRFIKTLSRLLKSAHKRIIKHD